MVNRWEPNLNIYINNLADQAKLAIIFDNIPHGGETKNKQDSAALSSHPDPDDNARIFRFRYLAKYTQRAVLQQRPNCDVWSWG
jgi:hypothetical protein